MLDSYVVDLRSELDRLAPFLNGRGGVVHVRASPRAPASVFARTIRAVMIRESRAITWKSVQIEPSNASTHYVADIIVQISETCEIRLERRRGHESPSITIGSDIKASGDVDVSNINVSLGGDPFDQAIEERERILDLVTSLAELLSTTRVALIFLGMHNTTPDIVRAIRRQLWDARLETLVERGLLLIDISNPDEMSVNPETWPPPANDAFDLPELLDDYAKAAATEDLTKIALAEEIFDSCEQASAFARTLVAASRDIRDLHANLALAISGLH